MQQSASNRREAKRRACSVSWRLKRGPRKRLASNAGCKSLLRRYKPVLVISSFLQSGQTLVRWSCLSKLARVMWSTSARLPGCGPDMVAVCAKIDAGCGYVVNIPRLTELDVQWNSCVPEEMVALLKTCTVAAVQKSSLRSTSRSSPTLAGKLDSPPGEGSDNYKRRRSQGRYYAGNRLWAKHRSHFQCLRIP